LATVDEPIHLANYDSDWPLRFDIEANRLRSALSAHDIAIEHIGSTAVPGMIAKPVVDITIGLKEWRSLDAVRQILAANGYEDLDQAGVPERVYFRCRVPKAFNVHVVRYAGVHWVNNLALREFLRTHPAQARAYSESKRIAFELSTRMLLDYSERKAAFLSELIEQARTWTGSH
jgi:GrpB-like predicted nucleotidyltransferase (UPF0157 family)